MENSVSHTFNQHHIPLLDDVKWVNEGLKKGKHMLPGLQARGFAPPSATPADLLYLAHIAEQTERWDDMAVLMLRLIRLKPVLTPMERNMFSLAYKNVVTQRRCQWRVLASMLQVQSDLATQYQRQQQNNRDAMNNGNAASDGVSGGNHYQSGGSGAAAAGGAAGEASSGSATSSSSHLMEPDPDNQFAIQLIKTQIETEVATICREVVGIIVSTLLPGCAGGTGPNNGGGNGVEARIFYLKMKGDYHRYHAELGVGGGALAAFKTESALDAYTQAFELSNEKLSSVHPLRLGVIVNLSVFYLEVINDIQSAVNIARGALGGVKHDIAEALRLRNDFYNGAVGLTKEGGETTGEQSSSGSGGKSPTSPTTKKRNKSFYGSPSSPAAANKTFSFNNQGSPSSASSRGTDIYAKLSKTQQSTLLDYFSNKEEVQMLVAVIESNVREWTRDD